MASSASSLTLMQKIAQLRQENYCSNHDDTSSATFPRKKNSGTMLTAGIVFEDAPLEHQVVDDRPKLVIYAILDMPGQVCGKPVSASSCCYDIFGAADGNNNDAEEEELLGDLKCLDLRPHSNKNINGLSSLSSTSSSMLTDRTLQCLNMHGMYFIKDGAEEAAAATDGHCQHYYYIRPGIISCPMFLGHLKIQSINLQSADVAEYSQFITKTPCTFENVCGCAALSNQFNMKTRIQQLLRPADSSSPAGSSLSTMMEPYAGALKKTHTSFGECYELFTVRGNITVRETRHEQTSAKKRLKNSGKGGKGKKRRKKCDDDVDDDYSQYCDGDDEPAAADLHHNYHFQTPGSCSCIASFKGVRDLRSVYTALTDVLGPEIDIWPSSSSSSTSDKGYRHGFFKVHMAVVSSCLGKRLNIGRNCIFERALISFFGDKKDGEEPGCIDVVSRFDGENAFKARVTDWKKMRRFENGFVDDDNDHDKNDDDGDMDTQLDPWFAAQNTVTVTCRGAVIVRLSWEYPIDWGPEVENGILENCEALCKVLGGCC